MATQFAFGKIVTDGLVLALDAADRNSYPGSGTTWNDVSGNANNGTLTNGPTFNSDNGGNIVFDGTNDYVGFGAIGSLSSFTANYWFSVSAFTLEGFFLITSDNSIGLSVRSATGNTLAYWDGNSTAGIYGVGATVLQTNTIYNGTFVRNSSTGLKTIYLNANTDFTGSAVNNLTNTGFSLGYYPQASRGGLNGRVYSVQIYNRALSATEVAQNYNTQKSRFGL
jgi:hypothetical protein